MADLGTWGRSSIKCDRRDTVWEWCVAGGVDRQGGEEEEMGLRRGWENNRELGTYPVKGVWAL